MPDAQFFRTDLSFTLKELVEVVGGELQNPALAERVISGVAPVDVAAETDITFLSNSKYAAAAFETQAGACIIHPKYADKLPKNTAAVLSENPYVAYAKIAAKLHPAKLPQVGVSEKASVAPSATIGKNCFIGDFAIIGENVTIGDNTFIYPGAIIGDSVSIGHHSVIYSQVTIAYSHIGNHVTIHTGARVGQDGFGFATEHGRHLKVPQLGRVIIEDFVDIGANSCIDRGSGPDTVIGEGTHIDNLVQIGHNVTIGRGCILVAQVGVAGSTKIGNYVVLGGQVGVAGHLTIGDMAQAAAQSGVTKDIPSGAVYGGYPAVPVKDWHRQAIILKKMVKKTS